MSLKVGSQVSFVADDSRRGHVVALDGDTATVALKGSDERVDVATAELKTRRGRPAKVA